MVRILPWCAVVITSASRQGQECDVDFLVRDPKDRRIVDLRPKEGMPREFDCRLDFDMRAFEVAASAGECELTGDVNSRIPIDAGSSVYVSFAAMDADLHVVPENQYGVNATRLLGSEVTLLDLEVQGASLIPAFKPGGQVYDVLMDVSQDIVNVVYRVLDNGQSVSLRAGPGAHPRKLGLLEGQYRKRRLETLIDPGTARNVSINVLSADQSNTGAYFLRIRRPPCPPDNPFFDTETRACTATCNLGWYPELALQRCSQCPDHCLDCQGPRCSRCAEGFAVDARGNCPAAAPSVELEDLEDPRAALAGMAALSGVLIICGVRNRKPAGREDDGLREFDRVPFDGAFE